MITLNNITMGFTNRTLFKDVSLSVFPDERIGLTGPNGAGKSTLFSIILGEREPLSGEVTLQKNINIGFLPQEAKFSSDRTVMEELTSGDNLIRGLVEEKHKLEEENKAASERYGDVLEELERLGIYELEHKAEKILSGLGFKEEEFHKPVVQLSGGWQMRTLLAKLLTYSYDLLLLDEPTNYLDLSATIWLKEFLTGYDGAFILISHDRVFLNDVTNYTIVLEGAQMMKVKGNYETFEEQKDIQQKHLERKKKVVDKKRAQLERFAQRFHAQPNRASAVRNKRKMIEKLEDIELDGVQESIEPFEFPDIRQSGYSVVQLKDIAKSYPDKKVYEDLDLEIIRGQKVCLVGPNGAGKSTLLKMLAGAIEPDHGEIKYGHNVDKGYFSQTRTDVLSANRNAFEEVAASGPQGVVQTQIRNLLGLFNFRGDDVFKPVNVLSGGEKSRLILAKLLIDPPNFMLLDEPTTHLDLDGVKALTSAFKKYTGTICFISHDLFFIREVADHIIEINNGQVKHYMGGLQYYLDKKAGIVSEVKKEKKKKVADRQDKQPKKEKEKGAKKEKEALKEMRRQHKAAKNRLAQIKKEIEERKKEAKELETESYVKARMLNKLYESKDSDKIKEFSQRLKDIQSRQRDIEKEIKDLQYERDKVSK